MSHPKAAAERRDSKRRAGDRRAGEHRSKAGGKRRRGREMAMQMLYQHELGGATLDEIFDTFDVADYVAQTESADEEDNADGEEQAGPVSEKSGADTKTKKPRPRRPLPQAQIEESFRYAQRLVSGTRAENQRVDELIRQHAENWRLERMPSIDRNILRLAVYEMLHEQKVPKVVIVDEAIELAKRFGSDHSSRFVNGLLDGILKSRALETETVPASTSANTSAGDSASDGTSVVKEA